MIFIRKLLNPLSSPPSQMAPQQCHEHGEESFFVYKGMLPTVVPPTVELECEDEAIPYQSNSDLSFLK